MTTIVQGQQCWSMYLKPSRPEIPRQRSTSLPAGLATMNAEEAGMIFSAAERATARRRNISIQISQAVDSTEESTSSPSLSPPTPSTIKYSPEKSEQPKSDVADLYQPKASQMETSENFELQSTIIDTSDLFKSLPISPLSPTKRQVADPSLKSYADQLFQFTQQRLVTTIPQVSPVLNRRPTDNIKEIIPPPVQRTHSQRPSLESHFSDWSVATGASRRTSLAYSPLPALDMDPTLLSPDSFFGGGHDEIEMREEVIRNGLSSGYASSATYEPPHGMPPPTPPSRAIQPPTEKDEFSYFANFDQYITTVEVGSAEQAAAEPPVSLAINLSPIETTVSPSPLLHPFSRRRAETMVHAPLLSNSYSNTPSTPLFAQSSPATPYNRADTSLKVPHWLIGAIG